MTRTARRLTRWCRWWTWRPRWRSRRTFGTVAHTHSPSSMVCGQRCHYGTMPATQPIILRRPDFPSRSASRKAASSLPQRSSNQAPHASIAASRVSRREQTNQAYSATSRWIILAPASRRMASAPAMRWTEASWAVRGSAPLLRRSTMWRSQARRFARSCAKVDPYRVSRIWIARVPACVRAIPNAASMSSSVRVERRRVEHPPQGERGRGGG